jgi:ribose 5-phosphate isomerase B
MEHRAKRPVAWAEQIREKSFFVCALFVFLGGLCMKVAIGADHGGVRLKDELITFIKSLGHEVEDLGCDCADAVDYPDYALPVCERVQQGKADRGILICGTGIGMSIAANKMKGIRCALVHDAFSAKATREHNDTNVLAMGERVIGPGYAQDIVGIWLGTSFSNQERHVNRINKISAIEANQ